MILMSITLSNSSLSLFLDCPRCFWLYKIKKISRPAGAFPSLPSGMDRVLKEHFDSHRAKKTIPPELEGFNGTLYPDLEKLKIWRSNFKGLRYTDLSGATLMGALDDLFVTSADTYVPVDFKTRGFPLKQDTHEHYQDQMNIYSLLLEKNDLPPAGFAILLFYHPKKVNKNHNIEFHAEPVKIPTSPKNALSLFTSALTCLQKEEPKPSKECGYCNWEGAT